MSDTKRAPRRKAVNSTEMVEFLGGLNLAVKPSLHINGSSYHQAVVTVDFGEPLDPVRLTNDQMHDLVSNMRSLTRDVIGRDASVNINTDNSRGVYWASIV